MTYLAKSPEALAICLPRWVDWPKSRKDPCDLCPLYAPCIKQPPGQGLESFNAWVSGINQLAGASA